MDAEDRGLVRTALADGVPLLLAVALGLVLAGGFAIFLALTGEFLPHDIRYLGMTATDLCSVAGCRVVRFMMHDRAAFGGALAAIGTLYTYLIWFPLRRGEVWAWHLLAMSGTLGFLSFLAYLGYGYLDTWHGVGTALLLPLFLVGLFRSRTLLRPADGAAPARRLPDLRWPDGLGRACLLVGAAGIALGGLEIFRVGVTDVFVAEDLSYLGVSVTDLRAVNPHLVSLIAHDRAGFGGAVCTTGLTALGCLWYGRLSRALWEMVLVASAVALAAAIGVHFLVGYVNLWHLTPALAAAASVVIGLALTYRTAHAAPAAGAAPVADAVPAAGGS